MATGAHFTINQAANTVPSGTLDTARIDLRQGQVIHFVGDSSGSQSTPAWTILAWPSGSARGAPSNAATFDASYTPDVPGSYLMQYLVNDGLAANAKRFVFCVTQDANGLIIDDGVREPAYGERVGDDNVGGNDRGFAKAYEVGLAAAAPAISNVTALRARKAAKHKQVNLLGWNVAGDGGGGLFRWDGSSTAADNGGTVFQPGFGTAAAMATGRWIRVYSGALHTEWFGVFFDSDDTKATTNRTYFNAMVAANPNGAHFIMGNRDGGYMAVNADLSDPTNPRCLILDNATGCTFSGQGQSTLIKYVGTTPTDPGATWYSSGTLAVMRGDFTSNCTFEWFTVDGNNKAHVGFWARNSWLFPDWSRVTFQQNTGWGLIIGRGNPGLSSVNLDGPSLYKCNVGYNGNGADVGCGRGGLKITDGNTNNYSVVECVIGVNGPANPLGGGIGSSNTDGCGIEVALYPRSGVLKNNQMFTNGARDIYVRKEFSTSLTIEEATHELYQGPLLEVENGSGGVHATGTIILRNVNTTYNFRAQASQSFTFNAATDVFTATAHGYSNGDAVTLANAGGALPAGYSGTVLYYVISVTANTFQLALTVGGSVVNGTTNGTGTNYVRKPYKIIDDKSGCTLILEGCRFQGPRGNYDAAGNVGVYDVAAVAGISKSMTNGAGGSYCMHFVGTVQQYTGAQVQLGGDVEAEGWLETGNFTTQPIVSRVYLQRRLSNVGPLTNDKVVLQQNSDKQLVTCTPEALVNARAITPASCVATGAIGGTAITGTTLSCSGEVVAATGTTRCRIGNVTGAYDGIHVGVAAGAETTSNAAFLSNGSSETLMQSPGAVSMRISGVGDMVACGVNTLGFYGATKVARPSGGSALTGSSGSAGSAIVDGGVVYDQTKTNNNNRAMQDQINILKAALASLGLIT